ncbi:MAG: GxGYxYP family putative glycoside hydrolase [Bacteroidota bacterium]|nr:GxGYxYP family putative glycoside hydrolase [Bacteroidota bacterium]
MRNVLLLIVFCFITANIPAQSIRRVEGSPYPCSTPPTRLYLTSENFSPSQCFAVESLQGIIAKTKPEILRDVNGYKTLLAAEGITIDETYVNDFAGLLAKFAPRLNGYILCTYKQSSSNVAMSLSGILNAVAIPEDIQQTAINAGLTMLLDVRGKDETWMLKNYGARFNKKIATIQNSTDDHLLFLGDYTAFTGGIQYWTNNSNSVLAKKVYSRLSSGSALFGWGPDEYWTVYYATKHNIVVHASDWIKDLSVLTNIPAPNLKQKEPVEPYKVIPNVHTVCFLMSDGDNVQWLAGAYKDTRNMASPDLRRFKMGWTISPALTEIAPIIYRRYLDDVPSTDEGRSSLVSGPSGRGYFLPSVSPGLLAECQLTNKYMKKADLNIVNVIDAKGVRDPAPFLAQSNIDAAFYYSYEDFYTGLNGTISWYRDKPSIGGRYQFWGDTYNADWVAGKLNAASTDIYSSDGYSLVPVHLWSTDPKEILQCIQKLGPNVRVVTPDEFVWLIRKNIARIPLGNGLGLRGDYYKGISFDTLMYTKTDGKIDYDWEDSSPNSALLGNDAFSVRWSGQIQPVYSGNTTFYVTAEGGAKLTINGTVVVDNLAGVGKFTKSGVIALTSGVKYDIELDYIEKTGDALCQLEWESTAQMRQTVPRTQLYSRSMPSTGVVTVYADTAFGGFSGGLKAGNYTLADLGNKGILDNNIASLKIGLGYKVILYEDDNFQGNSIELTSNDRDLGDWAGKVTSLKVMTNGATNLEGIYYLQNRETNLNMAVKGDSLSTADGVIIQQSAVSTASSQQFKLTHLGNGCYSITAVSDGLSLDVMDYSTDDDATIQQWTNYRSTNQQFILVPTGDGYYKIVAKHSSKLLEPAATYANVKIRQKTDTNQKMGQWRLVPLTSSIDDQHKAETVDADMPNANQKPFDGYLAVGPKLSGRNIHHCLRS